MKNEFSRSSRSWCGCTCACQSTVNPSQINFLSKLCTCPSDFSKEPLSSHLHSGEILLNYFLCIKIDFLVVNQFLSYTILKLCLGQNSMYKTFFQAEGRCIRGPSHPAQTKAYFLIPSTLMDIIYHIADFQKNILIVLTAFPLKLKNK